MWKCVIAAEASEETQEEKANCLDKPVDSITAIREEEEEQEQASKEEESADDLDEAEEIAAAEEEEVLPQSETSGEKEDVPEWDYKLEPPLKPGILTIVWKRLFFFPNQTLCMVASTSLWHNTVEHVLGKMCLTKSGLRTGMTHSQYIWWGDQQKTNK